MLVTAKCQAQSARKASEKSIWDQVIADAKNRIRELAELPQFRE
jgi:hypothetical protein